MTAGDIICIDDPHNVVDSDSSKVREGVLEWWDQAMQTRLNDPRTGAFVIIMQRVHELDLTGHILANELGNEWSHLCLPARYEIGHPTPSKSMLGFSDPRTKEGELLWPERIDDRTLSTLERSLGSYAAAGQLQQRPAPKGGGILKASWWVPWEKEDLPRHRICNCNHTIPHSKRRKAPASAPEPLGACLPIKAQHAPLCWRHGGIR